VITGGLGEHVVRRVAVWQRATRRLHNPHFLDPSLTVAALGAGPERLLANLNAMGFLFESLVVRDLGVLSQPPLGEVLHYRDGDGHEGDAIVQLADGRWAGFEVKLSSAPSDQAAASLTRVRVPGGHGSVCAAGGPSRHHRNWLRLPPS